MSSRKDNSFANTLQHADDLIEQLKRKDSILHKITTKRYQSVAKKILFGSIDRELIQKAGGTSGIASDSILFFGSYLFDSKNSQRSRKKIAQKHQDIENWTKETQDELSKVISVIDRLGYDEIIKLVETYSDYGIKKCIMFLQNLQK